jgi:hypothetical protein
MKTIYEKISNKFKRDLHSSFSAFYGALTAYTVVFFIIQLLIQKKQLGFSFIYILVFIFLHGIYQ